MKETQSNDESIMNCKQPTITGQVDAGVRQNFDGTVFNVSWSANEYGKDGEIIRDHFSMLEVDIPEQKDLTVNNEYVINMFEEALKKKGWRDIKINIVYSYTYIKQGKVSA